MAAVSMWRLRCCDDVVFLVGRLVAVILIFTALIWSAAGYAVQWVVPGIWVFD